MKKVWLLSMTVLFVSIVLIGIGCQSAEMTSAKVYINQKDYSQALVHLKNEIKNNPANAEAYFMSGQIYGEMDSLDQMVKMFDKTQQLDTTYISEITKWRKSKSGKAFNKGLNLWKKKKDLDGSIEWTLTSIEIDSTNISAWKNLGYLYQQKMIKFDKDNKQDSLKYYTELRIKTYKKAYSLDKKDEGLVAIMAGLYTLDSKADSAIVILTPFFESKNPKIFSAAADAYDALDKKDEALKMLTKMERLNPNDAGVLFDIGIRYYNMEDYDNAAGYFDKVIKINPNDLKALNNKGLALLNAGKLEEAESALFQVVKSNPANPDVWDQIGIVWAKLEKGKNATTAMAIKKALIADNMDEAKKLAKELGVEIENDK
ncbi:tetratricopeptide repeat protein [bacterium]|nr:tetratricopeptide repeat protein [bacterium]